LNLNLSLDPAIIKILKFDLGHKSPYPPLGAGLCAKQEWIQWLNTETKLIFA